jgi:hypothetical protein
MKYLYFYPPETEGFWAHYNFIKDSYFLRELETNNFKLVPLYNLGELKKGDNLIIFEAKNLLPKFEVFFHLSCVAKLYFLFNFIFGRRNYLRLNRLDANLILIIFESKLHAPENHFIKLGQLCDKVLTWNDNFTSNTKFEKYLLPLPFEWPQVQKKTFNERKMLVNISANKYFFSFSEFYSKRRSVIKSAEDFFGPRFELYGFDWNKPVTLSQRFFSFLTPFYKSYKGIVQDKSKVFSEFRFALIYENSSVEGYISEKIFDCLRSKCIPIYLGAPNILSYIPTNVFIDRNKFDTDYELFQFLESIDENYFNKYLENIDNYLSSEKFRENLSNSFARKIISVVTEMEHKSIRNTYFNL